jgi:hypothetical protein
MFMTGWAKLAYFQSVLVFFLVFRRRVIPVSANRAL